MIVLTLLTVVLGIIYLMVVFYLSCVNGNIHTVVYSPADPCNDEAEIRLLLFKYPNASVLVPTSNVNNILSRNNKRVIVQ